MHVLRRTASSRISRSVPDVYKRQEYEAVENYKSKKHIKDRTKRLGRINQLQREYKEIYGAGAEAVEDLIKKKVDLRQFVNKAE